MKKTSILIVLLALFSPLLLNAQIPKVSIPSFDLGLKVGANFEQLNGKTWDNGYKAGFLGGVFAGLRYHKIGVQIEGLFSQTHYQTTGSQLYTVYKGAPSLFNGVIDSTKQGNFRASYFNIPVLFEYKLIPMLWLQIGPQYSGIVSVKDENGFVNDAKGLFKSGAVSGVLGLELKLPLHLNAGARYILGFSSLNATDVSGAWQQRTLQLHLGWTFL